MRSHSGTCCGPVDRDSRDPGGHLEVEERQWCVQDDLQDGVDCHKDGAVFRAALRQLIPQQHHGNAAREADQDDASSVAGQVGQRGPRERHLRTRGTPLTPVICIERSWQCRAPGSLESCPSFAGQVGPKKARKTGAFTGRVGINLHPPDLVQVQVPAEDAYCYNRGRV